jgi:hypothetical protein
VCVCVSIYLFICVLNTEAYVYAYVLHVCKCLQRTTPCSVVPSQTQGSSSIAGPLNVRGNWHMSSDKHNKKTWHPNSNEPSNLNKCLPCYTLINKDYTLFQDFEVVESLVLYSSRLTLHCLLGDGRDSSVGIVTGYGLDGPGSNPSGGEIFHTHPE